MISRKSCFVMVEKLSKFDVDQAPPRNALKSNISIFPYTVSTLDPPSRENRGSPGRAQEVKFRSRNPYFLLVSSTSTFVYKTNEIINIFRNADIYPFIFRLKTNEFI